MADRLPMHDHLHEHLCPGTNTDAVNNHESDIWVLLEIWFDFLLIASNYG
jgi:hypothetical protein